MSEPRRISALTPTRQPAAHDRPLPRASADVSELAVRGRSQPHDRPALRGLRGDGRLGASALPEVVQSRAARSLVRWRLEASWRASAWASPVRQVPRIATRSASAACEPAPSRRDAAARRRAPAARSSPCAHPTHPSSTSWMAGALVSCQRSRVGVRRSRPGGALWPRGFPCDRAVCSAPQADPDRLDDGRLPRQLDADPQRGGHRAGAP
jgi:hypothetical protein